MLRISASLSWFLSFLNTKVKMFSLIQCIEVELSKFFKKFFIFNYRIVISFCNSVIILFLNEDVIKFKNFSYFIVLEVVSNNIRKSNEVSCECKVLIYKFSSLLLSKFIRYSYIKRRVASFCYFR